MKEDIIKLQQENERLIQMAETDGLTGLYNRSTVEEKISRVLQETKHGIMIVLDVDHFKQVNDRYGHIVGDRLLQKIAESLERLTLHYGLLGRVGGDEFVIFLPVPEDLSFAETFGIRVRDQLSAITLPGARSIKISVTLGYARYMNSEGYQSLFDRADQMMIRGKRDRAMEKKEKNLMPDRGIDMDMKRIRAELAEHTEVGGAFCQDYETFKSIYRFLERRIRRSNENAYMILFTLTNGKGDFPLLKEREAQMTVLGEKIQQSLRIGDVYTQYSSGQFLVIVCNATEEAAEQIALRIQNVFHQALGVNQKKPLLHYCYPLKPAEIPKTSSSKK